jgi:hypothetical protein
MVTVEDYSVAEDHRADGDPGMFMLFACLLAVALCPAVVAAQSTAPAGPMKPFYRSPMPLLPPAIGPTCESIPLPSPDNHCAAHYVRTRGKGWNAQTSARLKCEWADGGTFEDEIIRIFSADQPMHLRWIDSNTLEVGLPTDAGFSPPRDNAEHFGHSIRYIYRPLSSQDRRSGECFDQPENFRNWRELYRPRAAGEAGWVTYGSEQTCLLAGQTEAAAPDADPIALQFMKAAMARLPFGTTELVLSAASRHHLQRAPQIILEPEESALVLQPSGPGGQHRVSGAQAQRVLRQLAQGGGVQLLLVDERGAAQNLDIAHKDFAAAHAAFAKCIDALRTP